jgi:hypothetical protein
LLALARGHNFDASAVAQLDGSKNPVLITCEGRV